MAQAVDYPLVGSFNNARIDSVDAERNVNCYEYIDLLSKKKKSLYPTSGIKDTGLDFDTNTHPFRATFLFNGNVYAVVGNAFYVITQNNLGVLSVTKLSGATTLNTTSGYVGITANTYQIIFVDGIHGYIFDTLTTTFTQIADAGFPSAPIDVCYLDGFFVVANGNTNNFQLSMFNQGLIWSQSTSTFTMGAASANIHLTSGNTSTFPVGTQVVFSGGSLPVELVAGTIYYVVSVNPTTSNITVSATQGGAAIVSIAGGSGSFSNNGQLQQGAITSDTGTIVACKVLHRRLFLFSQFFTEVWENQGIGTNLPFRRNNTLLMEVGTPAIASVSVGFDKMFFLSQDRDGLGSVMMVQGTESVPVSSHALDYQLSLYAQNRQVSDATAMLIKENGIIFYRLNFTAADHTWVYNVTMSQPGNDATLRWHEEQLLDGTRHPAQTHVFLNGSNYYGDYLSPIFYLVDGSLNTNNGEDIKRMRIGQPVCPSGYQRTRIDRFQIDLLQGQLAANFILDNEILLTENGLDILAEDGDAIITDQEFIENMINTPILFFSYSKDGGQSFEGVQRLQMGNVGQRTFRTVARKLGVIPRGQAFVPKIEFYTDYPFFVLGASWVYEVLPE